VCLLHNIEERESDLRRRSRYPAPKWLLILTNVGRVFTACVIVSFILLCKGKLSPCQNQVKEASQFDSLPMNRSESRSRRQYSERREVFSCPQVPATKCLCLPNFACVRVPATNGPIKFPNV